MMTAAPTTAVAEPRLCPCCGQPMIGTRLGMEYDEIWRADQLGMNYETHSFLAGADFRAEVEHRLELAEIRAGTPRRTIRTSGPISDAPPVGLPLNMTKGDA